MNGKINILFLSKNPGGFNAIYPIFLAIKADNTFNVNYIFDEQSSKLTSDKKIAFSKTDKISKKSLSIFLKDINPKIIFCGTSSGMSIDKLACELLRGQNTKRVSIVDSWTNYKQRFSDKGTTNLKYLPDYILIIDKLMREQMIKQGFSKKKLIVIGNPFFDSFKRIKTRSTAREGVISFFCQPFSEIENNNCGFDEIQVFGDLIWAAQKNLFNRKIVIKLHPLSKRTNKFSNVIKNCGLSVSVDNKISSEALIEKSDLVTGMNSMVLFKAAVCGARVLSYQPNLNFEDPLVSNKLSISTAAYRRADLPEKMSIAMKSESKHNLKIFNRYAKNRSTKRVINFIKSL